MLVVILQLYTIVYKVMLVAILQLYTIVYKVMLVSSYSTTVHYSV